MFPPSPALRLAWKEWRQMRLPVLFVTGVIVLASVLTWWGHLRDPDAILHEILHSADVLLISVLAVMIGGSTLADERTSGRVHLMASLPTRPRGIWILKVLVGLLQVVVLTGISMVLFTWACNATSAGRVAVVPLTWNLPFLITFFSVPLFFFALFLSRFVRSGAVSAIGSLLFASGIYLALIVILYIAAPWAIVWPQEVANPWESHGVLLLLVGIAVGILGLLSFLAARRLSDQASGPVRLTAEVAGVFVLFIGLLSWHFLVPWRNVPLQDMDVAPIHASEDGSRVVVSAWPSLRGPLHSTIWGDAQGMPDLFPNTRIWKIQHGMGAEISGPHHISPLDGSTIGNTYLTKGEHWGDRLARTPMILWSEIRGRGRLGGNRHGMPGEIYKCRNLEGQLLWERKVPSKSIVEFHVNHESQTYVEIDWKSRDSVKATWIDPQGVVVDQRFLNLDGREALYHPLSHRSNNSGWGFVRFGVPGDLEFLTNPDRCSPFSYPPKIWASARTIEKDEETGVTTDRSFIRNLRTGKGLEAVPANWSALFGPDDRYIIFKDAQRKWVLWNKDGSLRDVTVDLDSVWSIDRGFHTLAISPSQKTVLFVLSWEGGPPIEGRLLRLGEDGELEMSNIKLPHRFWSGGAIWPSENVVVYKMGHWRNSELYRLDLKTGASKKIFSTAGK